MSFRGRGLSHDDNLLQATAPRDTPTRCLRGHAMRCLPLALVLLPACSTLPGLDHPQITLVPQYALLRVTGNTSMQSSTGAGGVQNNPAISHRDMGFGDRDEDWGGMVRFGDEFSGLDLSYLKVDQKASRPGALPSDWGALQAGDPVQTKVFMDEFRLRYVGEVFEHETEDGAVFAAGAGAMLTHRELALRASEANLARAQNVDISDDVLPYLALRAGANYRAFGARVDYAINPDLSFGGEFDGVMHDLEVVGTYTFEDQDLTVYAGYRRADLKAKGTEQGFAYSADLLLDGYIFGVHFTF